MIKTLIASNPTFKKEKPNNDNYLLVAEFFGDTIQGENWSGVPSTFLRLQGCTLECIWCDTLEVWRYGNPYTFDELFEMMESSGIMDKLKKGQHLIITGGSPLKQQERLTKFIITLKNKYNFTPIIEIENECTILPSKELSNLVTIWNNSPKLSNSGMKKISRYKPDILKHMANLNWSFFKFVISNEEDWNEIEKDFISLGIDKNQIVIMPEGQTREELQMHYEIVINIAIRENIRMCDRLHVTIWDKKTGV